LVELKRLNTALTKRNAEQEQELDRLRKLLENSSAEGVATLRKKIAELKECAKDVSH